MMLEPQKVCCLQLVNDVKPFLKVMLIRYWLMVTKVVTHNPDRRRDQTLDSVTYNVERRRDPTLVEVIAVADVDAEKRVDNSLVQNWKVMFGHKVKFFVQTLSTNFGQDLKS